MKLSLLEVRKAIAAAAAAAAVMVGAGLVTGSAAAWITGAIATLSTLVVTYLAPTNLVKTDGVDPPA